MEELINNNGVLMGSKEEFRVENGRQYSNRKLENLLHINRYIETDGVDTQQWQQVLKDCAVRNIKVSSPQTKGKVERSYRWIQAHSVRNCMKERITNIEDGQKILDE